MGMRTLGTARARLRLLRAHSHSERARLAHGTPYPTFNRTLFSCV